MARPVTLPVRDFAQPAPRTGSIETASGMGSLAEEGVVAHRLLQAKRQKDDPTYQVEVAIARTFKAGRYSFRVAGRMDGYIPGPEPLIEEIKSAFDPERLKQRLLADPDHPYWLQLLTYAYMVHGQTGIAPHCHLTLTSLRTQIVTATLEVTFDLARYEAWLERRLAALEKDEIVFRANARRRKRLGGDLPFPFTSPRPGQKELVASLGELLTAHDQVLLEAPTGLGKTAGVMTPTLKDSLCRGCPTLYITAKNSQQTAAEDAAKRLNKQGAKVRALTLSAKHRICMQDEPVCSAERCEYAKDYYTKVSEHDLARRIARSGIISERKLKRYAEKYKVCPYELALDAAPYTDLIISDYNFVISPHGLIGRVSHALRGKGAKPSLIIDEAHNLPSRAAENLSASLSRLELNQIRDAFGASPYPIDDRAMALLDDMDETITSVAPEHGDAARIVLSAEVFLSLEEQARKLFASHLASEQAIEKDDPTMRLLRMADGFQATVALASHAESSAYVSIYERTSMDEAIRLICLDPSLVLQETMLSFAKVVGFSATLQPFDYYSRLSGFSDDKLATYRVASPFPRENRKLIVIPQVSTKLRNRSKHIERIADAIGRITAVRPGNYAAFFPSFRFLEDTAKHLKVPGFTIITQKPKTTRAEVRALLERLAEREKPALLMAVQGGGLSEGLDFPGELLVGAIIVGPALPTVGPAREAQKVYFDERYGRGDDYAYTVPAMTRVVQAAGRVIRSERDRGLIVLMDERFIEPRFASLMPKDWYENSVKELVSTRILDDIRAFWAAGPDSQGAELP